LANDYGPTETTVWVTTKDVEPELESMSWLPIGRPSPGCFVYVLDGFGRQTPIGIPGEIHIGGNQVAEGYLNRPDLTAERFVADPWNPGGRMYRSGDLGRWLPNGDLEVLGRLDRQLKIRGFRVEPGEVEAAIRRLEGVADCAVVPTSDGTGERSLVAYVVMEGSHRFDSTILRDRLKQLVPAFLVPAHLIDVPVLPRNLSGKVDFAQLPQPVAESTSESLPHHVVPASPIEISLVEIWTEVLGRHMAANSNFFEEGGHSLLAIRVMSRIQARLGVEIPLSALFTHPTVSELAKVVAEGIAESSGAELESMLDELEAMSDEDATVLLAKLAAEDSSA
jgi:acyl carrier protein